MWFGDLVQNVQVVDEHPRVLPRPQRLLHYIHDSIKNDKPYDQMVREIIAGTGDSFTTGAANFWVRQIQQNGPIQDTYDNLAAHSRREVPRHAAALPLLPQRPRASRAGQHLSEVASTRYDFWGNAAFFARDRARGSSTPIRTTRTRTVKFIVSDNADRRVPAEHRPPATRRRARRSTAQPTPSRRRSCSPARRRAPASRGATRTAACSPRDPQFARATVNYLWKEMFGLGIVEPANTFDLARLDPNKLPTGQTLQPTHPKLLEDSPTTSSPSGYDLRAILRTMAMSNAYQLSSQYTPATWNEAWTPYFARHYPHRLMAR